LFKSEKGRKRERERGGGDKLREEKERAEKIFG
jgi:hypothetical protein